MQAILRALVERTEFIRLKARQWGPAPIWSGVAVAILAIAAPLMLRVSHTHKRPATPIRIAQSSTKRAPHVAPAKAKPAPRKPVTPLSDFAKEQQMSFSQLMNRWNPYVAEAAKRFAVPQPWIRAVMQIESGGRTMLDEKQRIVSSTGAMGLMQLMPSTYDDMRQQYGLGADPYDPHDNILAGAAYLRFLRGRYGYPTMFAAYNDGPGNLEERMMRGGLLPLETQNYIGHIANTLAKGGAGNGGAMVKFTRPNGAPVAINAAAVIAVRAAFPDEYAPGVQSVITVGRVRQGVRESPARARAILRAHGGGV